MTRIFFPVLALFFVLSASANEVSDTIATFKKAEATHPFFNNAYGYAVFPTVGKAGFVIGAAYGEGKVFRQGAVSGTTSLAQVTIGFQLGGQAYSEVIFFEDKRAYDEFTSGTFEFSAQATAVAITIGAQAHAGTTGTSSGAGDKSFKGSYYKGMTIFTHTKGGLMYEASLGGQKFSFDAN